MDFQELQLEVFKQTKKKIEPDDPFYVAFIMLEKMAYLIENKNANLIANLLKSADKYNQTRSYWHHHSEKLIAEQINQVKLAVLEISSVKNYVGEVSTSQAKTQLQPILSEITNVLDLLQRKDKFAVEQIRNISDIQDRWSRTAFYVVTGFILVSLLTGLGGFYVGKILSGQEIAKNAEWLASDDGKYALQLRDAGSLKQLATCHPEQESSGWKIKDGNSCIPSPVQTKNGLLTIGWRLSP